MNAKEKEQALAISALYGELAEQGTWFEYSRYEKSSFKATECSPSIGSKLNCWRVAEKQDKIVDMSCLVGSDVDCEFTNLVDFDIQPYHTAVGCLTGFDNSTNKNYAIHNDVNTYRQCRVRQDHWHSWQGGGECPLPEGLLIQLKFGKEQAYDSETRAEYSGERFNKVWRLTTTDYRIVAFKVIGTAEGWKYEE